MSVCGCKPCNSAVYYTGMQYSHNDIFLTDVIGYDRLKFSYICTPKNATLGTPMEFSYHFHSLQQYSSNECNNSWITLMKAEPHTMHWDQVAGE